MNDPPQGPSIGPCALASVRETFSLIQLNTKCWEQQEAKGADGE